MSSHVIRRGASSQPRRLTPDELREKGDSCDVDVVHLAAVKAARAALPNDIRIDRSAALLGLLANTTRLKILIALQAAAGDSQRSLCVCDIAVVAGVSKSMASHQLRLLRVAGLVEPRRVGKLTFYELVAGKAKDLLDDALAIALSPPRRRGAR